MAVEMAEQTKEIALAGIRARGGCLSAREISAEWIRLLHGEEVAAGVP